MQPLVLLINRELSFPCPVTTKEQIQRADALVAEAKKLRWTSAEEAFSLLCEALWLYGESEKGLSPKRREAAEKRDADVSLLAERIAHQSVKRELPQRQARRR